MAWCRCLMVIVVAGCASDGGHDHGEDVPEDHHGATRDPATEPCDASNWRDLVPDLRQCHLASQTLDGESLRRVDLSEANLENARLVGADLFTARLRAAHLQGAALDQAKLTGADLGGADLTGASLRGANLTNANLTSAQLVGAITDETTTCPTGDVGPCW